MRKPSVEYSIHQIFSFWVKVNPNLFSSDDDDDDDDGGGGLYDCSSK